MCKVVTSDTCSTSHSDVQFAFVLQRRDYKGLCFRIKCLAKVLFLSHGKFSRYEIHMTLDFLAETPGERETWRLLSLPDNLLKRNNYK